MANSRDNADERPDPDPTRLTTQQLIRELYSLRELIEARLDGMDKANKVLAENVLAQAKLAQAEVEHLKSLHDERFLSVAQQFQERDIRDNIVISDAKEAVTAAMTAARERAALTNEANAATAQRVEKSLNAQLQQIGELAAAGRDQLSDQIAALKERLDRGEGSSSGAAESRTEQRATRGETSQVMVIVIMVISALIAAASVIVLLVHH